MFASMVLHISGHEQYTNHLRNMRRVEFIGFFFSIINILSIRDACISRRNSINKPSSSRDRKIKSTSARETIATGFAGIKKSTSWLSLKKPRILSAQHFTFDTFMSWLTRAREGKRESEIFVGAKNQKWIIHHCECIKITDKKQFISHKNGLKCGKIDKFRPNAVLVAKEMKKVVVMRWAVFLETLFLVAFVFCLDRFAGMSFSRSSVKSCNLQFLLIIHPFRNHETINEKKKNKEKKNAR